MAKDVRTTSATVEVDLPFAVAEARLGARSRYAKGDLDEIRRKVPWAGVTPTGEGRYSVSGRDPATGFSTEGEILFERPYHLLTVLRIYDRVQKGGPAGARGTTFVTMTTEERAEPAGERTRLTRTFTFRAAPGGKLPLQFRVGWGGQADGNRIYLQGVGRELKMTDAEWARVRATAPARARLDRIGLALLLLGGLLMLGTAVLAASLPSLLSVDVVVGGVIVGVMIMFSSVPLIIKRRSLER